MSSDLKTLNKSDLDTILAFYLAKKEDFSKVKNYKELANKNEKIIEIIDAIINICPSLIDDELLEEQTRQENIWQHSEKLINRNKKSSYYFDDPDDHCTKNKFILMFSERLQDKIPLNMIFKNIFYSLDVAEIPMRQRMDIFDFLETKQKDFGAEYEYQLPAEYVNHYGKQILLRASRGETIEIHPKIKEDLVKSLSNKSSKFSELNHLYSAFKHFPKQDLIDIFSVHYPLLEKNSEFLNWAENFKYDLSELSQAEDIKPASIRYTQDLKLDVRDLKTAILKATTDPEHPNKPNKDLKNIFNKSMAIIDAHIHSKISSNLASDGRFDPKKNTDLLKTLDNTIVISFNLKPNSFEIPKETQDTILEISSNYQKVGNEIKELLLYNFQFTFEELKKHDINTISFSGNFNEVIKTLQEKKEISEINTKIQNKISANVDKTDNSQSSGLTFKI